MPLGGGKATEVLRTGIAMGADEAVQIIDPALEGSDLFTVARVVAAYLKDKPFDAIFAGRQAMDDDIALGLRDDLNLDFVGLAVRVNPDPVCAHFHKLGG
jgi:electron transfer flavoprotein beta subunit